MPRHTAIHIQRLPGNNPRRRKRKERHIVCNALGLIMEVYWPRRTVGALLGFTLV